MGKPHKHAALIHAWADGAQIQVQAVDGSWKDSDNPWWENDTEYRIKPNTININGFEVPGPLTCVKNGDIVYIVSLFSPDLVLSYKVIYPKDWIEPLSKGIVYGDRESAHLLAEALLSFTQQKD